MLVGIWYHWTPFCAMHKQTSRIPVAQHLEACDALIWVSYMGMCTSIHLLKNWFFCVKIIDTETSIWKTYQAWWSQGVRHPTGDYSPRVQSIITSGIRITKNSSFSSLHSSFWKESPPNHPNNETQTHSVPLNTVHMELDPMPWRIVKCLVHFIIQLTNMFCVHNLHLWLPRPVY